MKQKYCPYIFLAFAKMGMTTYEIGRLTGANHSNVSTHLRKLGYCRGKGNDPKRAERDEAKREEGQRRFMERFAERYGDRFDYLGGYVSTHSKAKPLLRCKACGHEFNRYIDWDFEIRCPECHKREVEQRKADKAAEKAERMANRPTFTKVCDVCGKTFETEHEAAKRCSAECRRKSRRKRTQEKRRRNKESSRANHRKRARRYGCEYDPSVTLPKLIERDGLTCWLCGEECDPNDKTWGCDGAMYPTIDHVIAMANGGGHTWDNVKVAHALCNSKKRDLMVG